MSPLAVTIAGESYRELDEMDAERFVALINKGNMPRSSQPALDDVMDAYAVCGDGEVLNIAMADGLSGTYSTAVAAGNASGSDKITVMNSGTLCGPHRHLVETAVMEIFPLTPAFITQGGPGCMTIQAIQNA